MVTSGYKYPAPASSRMEFTDGEVVIDRPPNDLDRLLLDVTTVLDDAGVEYAAVSGYVAVLFGRARATEDIDVIVERVDAETADEVASTLRDRGLWGTTMPLDRLYDTLVDGLPFRIAEDDHLVPNVELKFPTDEYDRTSLNDATTVRLADRELRIGGLELQIAYKLGMGARKDFEDALHLYRTVEGNLNVRKLEGYVQQLGVEDEYDKLRGTR